MNDTDKTPADWVLFEAAKRVNWPYNKLTEDRGLWELRYCYNQGNIGVYGAYVYICDMIAKHEQQPVDPDVEAVKQIFASVGVTFVDQPERMFMALGEDKLHAAVAQYKQERAK